MLCATVVISLLCSPERIQVHYIARQIHAPNVREADPHFLSPTRWILMINMSTRRTRILYALQVGLLCLIFAKWTPLIYDPQG